MRDPVIERMRRDIKAHAREGPRVAHEAAYSAMVGASFSVRIPVDTAATLRSATPWVGRPRIAHVSRGPQYPARGAHDARAASRSFVLGQVLGISTQHPGGLLARGGRLRSGPRAGQLVSRKSPEGFHHWADREARRAFERWKWRRGA